MRGPKLPIPAITNLPFGKEILYQPKDHFVLTRKYGIMKVATKSMCKGATIALIGDKRCLKLCQTRLCALSRKARSLHKSRIRSYL